MKQVLFSALLAGFLCLSNNLWAPPPDAEEGGAAAHPRPAFFTTNPYGKEKFDYGLFERQLVSRDTREAAKEFLPLLEKRATDNKRTAQYTLGRILYTGALFGMQSDQEKGIEWMKCAASQGQPAALQWLFSNRTRVASAESMLHHLIFLGNQGLVAAQEEAEVLLGLKTAKRFSKERRDLIQKAVSVHPCAWVILQVPDMHPQEKLDRVAGLDHPGACFERAWRLRERHPDQAMALYLKAARRGEPLSMESLATQLLARGNMLRGRKWADRAADKGLPMGWYYLARCLYQQELRKEGDAFFKKADELETCYQGREDPDRRSSISLQYRQAAEACAAHPQDAINLMTKAIDCGDTDNTLLHNIGDCYEREGDVAQAQAYYEKAIRAKCLQAHNRLGALFLKQGKTREARACFQTGTKGGDLNAQYNWAHELLKDVQPQTTKQAIQLLKAAAGAGHKKACKLYVHRQEKHISYTEAQALLSRFAKVDPKACYTLGVIALNTKKWTEACRWFESLAQAGDPKAQTNLAGAFIWLQRFEEAASWAAKALEQGDLLASPILQYCLTQQGHYEEAFSVACEGAVSGSPFLMYNAFAASLRCEQEEIRAQGREWLTQAARAGDPIARKTLKFAEAIYQQEATSEGAAGAGALPPSEGLTRTASADEQEEVLLKEIEDRNLQLSHGISSSLQDPATPTPEGSDEQEEVAADESPSKLSLNVKGFREALRAAAFQVRHLAILEEKANQSLALQKEGLRPASQKTYDMLLNPQNKVSEQDMLNLLQDPLFDGLLSIRRTRSGVHVAARFPSGDVATTGTHRNHSKSYVGFDHHFDADIRHILEQLLSPQGAANYSRSTLLADLL